MGADMDVESEEKNSMLLSVLSKGTEIQNNLKECQEKEREMQIKLVSLEQRNNELLQVLLEYDGLILNILNERNLYREGVDILSFHLSNLEFAFNDLHTKYDRAKKVVEGYQINENVLKNALDEYEKHTDSLQDRFGRLRDWSEKKLQEANEMINEISDKHETETYWLKAKIKTLEINKKALQENYNQKCIENNKLSMLYDNYISDIQLDNTNEGIRSNGH